MLLEQARVIIRALEDLPDDLDPQIVALAEKTLVAEAAAHDATALTKLGAHILTVIAPEIGEEHDRKKLEEAERQAAMRRRFTMTRDGHGSVRGTFTLPELQGAMLEKALHAFAAPKHQQHQHSKNKKDAACTGHETPEGQEAVPAPALKLSPQRLGEAFAELVETLDPTRMPKVGRMNATVVVILDLHTLLTGIGYAILDTGGRISAAEARRLACEAHLVPMVLNGDSEILNQGHAQRLYGPAQRLTMEVRDGGCTALGCDWPPWMCHAHHNTPWSKGGKTDVDDGRLLCPRHHARIHDPAYEAKVGADNQVTFHRRR